MKDATLPATLSMKTESEEQQQKLHPLPLPPLLYWVLVAVCGTEAK